MSTKRGLDFAAGALAGVAQLFSFRATGTVANPGVVDSDVFVFGNMVPDTYAAGEVICPTILQTNGNGFTMQQIAEHFLVHPAPPVNMNIPNLSPDAIGSGTLSLRRKTPDGKYTNLDFPLSSYLTSMDQQTNRVQVPLSGQEKLDGYTYMRVSWASMNPVVSNVLISITLGAGFDARSMVPDAPPLTI